MNAIVVIKKDVHHHGPNAILFIAVAPNLHSGSNIRGDRLLGRGAKIAAYFVQVPAIFANIALDLGENGIAEDLLDINQLVVVIKDTAPGVKIGRASCRERVEMEEVSGIANRKE